MKRIAVFIVVVGSMSGVVFAGGLNRIGG
ncbi:MAG: hypothetical protein US74_C0046G0001, partial [Parcubacteria group bacterium GW2011_GWA2_38_13]